MCGAAVLFTLRRGRWMLRHLQSVAAHAARAGTARNPFTARRSVLQGCPACAQGCPACARAALDWVSFRAAPGDTPSPRLARRCPSTSCKSERALPALAKRFEADRGRGACALVRDTWRDGPVACLWRWLAPAARSALSHFWRRHPSPTVAGPACSTGFSPAHTRPSAHSTMFAH